MNPPPPIRPATLADLDALVQLRMALLHETGGAPPSAQACDELAAQNRAFFSEYLDSARSRSWVAQGEGEALVGCVSLGFFHRPPYHGNPAGMEAYVLNVYVAPGARRQGLARRLVEAALAEAAARHCAKVWLHTQEAARPLYRSLGFAEAGSYMERVRPT